MTKMFWASCFYHDRNKRKENLVALFLKAKNKETTIYGNFYKDDIVFIRNYIHLIPSKRSHIANGICYCEYEV